jgi:hypothetical protein
MLPAAAAPRHAHGGRQHDGAQRVRDRPDKVKLILVYPMSAGAASTRSARDRRAAAQREAEPGPLATGGPPGRDHPTSVEDEDAKKLFPRAKTLAVPGSCSRSGRLAEPPQRTITAGVARRRPRDAGAVSFTDPRPDEPLVSIASSQSTMNPTAPVSRRWPRAEAAARRQRHAADLRLPTVTDGISMGTEGGVLAAAR